MKLTEKLQLIDNIWSFRFQPDEPVTCIAGQYVRVELPHDNPDIEGTKRWFTNSAAPYEGIIQITTRLTGTTFKQALSKLNPGDDNLELIEYPEGDFIWQDTKLPMIFVAGGIGITPFYSILKQRVHDHQPLSVTLIYAGRSDSLPFKNELAQWGTQNTEFKVKYLIGEKLTAQKLSELESNLNKSFIYISGPEPMVEALNRDLITNGLPESQLKHDSFPNYNEQNY